jgi:hypothetical protein
VVDAVNANTAAVQANSFDKFCAANPDNAACGDIATGGLADVPIGTKTVNISADLSHFSFAMSGSCPGDKTLSVGGQTVTVSYAPFCQFLGIFRYAAIAVATFAAGMILLGQRSTDSEA